MVELFEQDIKSANRQSSKGNQLKWNNKGKWYKADYSGYEGLAEYVVSNLLLKSSLSKDECVQYSQEQISYRRTVFNGAVSDTFVKSGWQIITLERLFKTKFNQSFYEATWRIADVSERFKFICSQVKAMTGLDEFDLYLARLLTIDAIFLNEDRHMHNIAVMMNSRQEFGYCPVFDNGACLLSDTTMDYPLGEDIMELMKECKAKTISADFDEQLETAEKICPDAIRFTFTQKDAEDIIMNAKYYTEQEKERVLTIIYQQMRKYSYLFGGNNE